MSVNPEKYSSFYTNDKLGFDLLLVAKAYKQFKPFFKSGSCLELGPATGYMTRFLVNDFEKVVVVEGALSLLSQIPDYENIKKYNALFEEFKPDEQFDTIILNHVLEHIENPIKLLQRIKNWLRPDGHLIIGVPNAKSFHRLAAVKMGLLKKENELNERDLELGHFRVYNFELLRSHSLQAGYKIFSEGGIFLKFLANNQIEKYLEKAVVDAYFDLGPEFKENSAEIFVVLKT